MTFVTEQQVEESILAKYFGVHDTTLKDLHTETSSDASFYKVCMAVRPSTKSLLLLHVLN